MHGLIGKMKVVAGQRDALVAILLDGVLEAQDAIARGRPLIAGFDQHITTVPVGGHGIPAVA